MICPSCHGKPEQTVVIETPTAWRDGTIKTPWTSRSVVYCIRCKGKGQVPDQTTEKVDALYG